MSLIIETLNRIETDEFKNYVPPSLLKNQKKDKPNSKKIYIYLGIFVSLSAPALYLSSLIGNITNENQQIAVATYNETKNQIVPEVNDIPVVPLEAGVNENINYLEKSIKEINRLKISSSVYITVKNSIDKILIPEVVQKQNIKKQPENLDAKFNSFVSMAETSYREGDLENSLKWYKNAYSIKKDSYVLNQILNIYIQKNNWATVNSLISDVKSEDLIYSFLVQLIDKNQTQLAEQILDEKIDTDKNGYLVYLKGLILENKGNTLQAEEFYKKAYDKNRLDPYFAYSYGRILEINKKYSKALKVYLQTKNLNLDNNLKSIIENRISILRGNLVF